MVAEEELPFFSDRHVALARAFEAWAVAEIAPLEMELQDDWGTLHRRALRKLADDGWLGKWYATYRETGKVDLRSICLMRETLAYHSDLADYGFATQCLASLPLLFSKDAALIERYVTPALRGEKLMAFAISEPDAGSDVSAVITSATADGDDYIISGSKAWLSCATEADHFLVLARSEPVEGALGLSLFVIDRGTAGISIEPISLIAPRPFGSMRLEQCRVPRTNLVGRAGRGFHATMMVLELVRPTVGAAAIGFAKRAIDEAIRWCKQRQVMGKSLSSMQVTQQKIGEMVTLWHAGRLLVYEAAWRLDTGLDSRGMHASMAKWYPTEVAQQIIDQAVQLLGARGLVSNSPVEKLYRQIRALRIYEGTTEIQKMIIATELMRKNR